MSNTVSSPSNRKVAYFSMEIGLVDEIPTYGGSLGMLAGDTIRAAADCNVPMVAVSLIYRKGYFYQRVDAVEGQIEEALAWLPEDHLFEETQRVSLIIDDRVVTLRVWRYDVRGVGGFIVPVYLLDADLEENTSWDKSLTDYLYGGDEFYRLCQEAVLGIGGLRMLRALGYEEIERFHMNEGHASLLTFEMLQELAAKSGRESCSYEDIEIVRKHCVCSTHTPVPAAHDQFSLALVERVLERADVFLELKDVLCLEPLSKILGGEELAIKETFPGYRSESSLNMTYLALNLSNFVNGVAKKHGEVSQYILARHDFDAISNGIHATTWTSEPFRKLFDRYVEGWKEDTLSLKSVLKIPKEEVWDAHVEAKDQLIHVINKETNSAFDRETFTIGFARRFATYKRPDLLFADVERLRSIVREKGALQVVYAGRAHPKDQAGKDIIRRILKIKEELRDDIKIAFLSNYGMELGRLICSGVDLWLNTPKQPMEASGTSGMKAALNGVPSLSVLDGWWIEGCIEGVTGWGIGGLPQGVEANVSTDDDAISLYEKLENDILPEFYNEREDFIEVMRHAIALNGSFFNTQRMMLQYVEKAYFCQ